MGEFHRDLDRYCRVYNVSPRGRLALSLHYPLFKLNWIADYGRSTYGRSLASALLRPFSKYSFRHEVQRTADDGLSQKCMVRVPFARNDFASFKEVLWSQCYQEVLEFGPVTTFVDLGANTGLAAFFFAARSSLRHALLVEANGSLIPTIQTNLSGVPSSTRFDVVNACVMAEDGPDISFNVSDNHRHSNVQNGDQLAEGTVRIDRIQRRGLRSLLDEHNLHEIDLIKIDVEGAEHDLIQDPAALRRARVLVIEVHGPLQQRDQFATHLENAGFAFTRSPQDSSAGCEVLVARRI